MNDFDRHSRVNKFEKRRKNTKAISILLIIGGILIIVLLGIWIFGGSDESDKAEPPTEQQNDNGQANNNESEDEGNEEVSDENVEDNEENSAATDDAKDEKDEADDQNSDKDDDEASIPSEDVETEEVDHPDDENVVKAYTGNWNPIGTEQSEPHEVKYDKESQDWKEMKDAVRYATGLTDMTTHWIGNDGGNQNAVATVSDPDKTNIYRVHIAWQTNEGWQPTKVEVLKEVDK